jgi:epoxide hydrolase-like predicted phosphatase
MTSIQAIIFDIGGVLLRTEDRGPRAALAARFGLDTTGIDQLVWGSPISVAAEEGRAEPADVWEHVRQTLNLSPTEIVEFETQFWAGDRMDRELFARLRSFRPQFKTGLLSNAWPKNVLALFYERYGLDRDYVESSFDVVVSSAAAGVRKPDARIFAHTAALLGLPGQKIVFVDDFLHNVEGARQAGWQAVHFKDREQALAELQALLD